MKNALNFMKFVILAALCAATPVSATRFVLEMPDYDCGVDTTGASNGWTITPNPVDKRSAQIHCMGGAKPPPPIVCTGNTIPSGNTCAACPAGTAPNASRTACVVAAWNGVCDGFSRTVVVDLNWAAPARIPAIPMGPNDVIVARFTTGTVDSADNNLPRISGAEWGSPPSARYAVLSATPCDFGAQKWQGAVSSANSVQVPFAVGTGNNFGYYPILAKATTYYFNIKNLTPLQSCSALGVCDMFVELGKSGAIADPRATMR